MYFFIFCLNKVTNILKQYDNNHDNYININIYTGIAIRFYFTFGPYISSYSTYGHWQQLMNDELKDQPKKHLAVLEIVFILSKIGPL